MDTEKTKREKLSIPGQISNMIKRGIKFEVIDENQAKRFLENNTYYFKLKAYEKNYDRYNLGEKAGQYINLDFAYLQDLSTIDSRLRKLLLQMCVDLEHFLKVYMLRDFNKSDEDGYEIIAEFQKRFPRIVEEIIEKKNGSTCAELISKYSDSFAIWNIVEVLSFRQTICLFELYCERQMADVKMGNALFSVRKLRNAAAHNNCLINNLRGMQEITANRDVVSYLKNNVQSLTPKKIERWMKHPVIHDFVVLLYTYASVVPEPTRGKAFTELHDFYEIRMKKHKEYYQKNQVILAAYDFTKKIVDNFYKECI